jgi:low affinity Fe/Cu permease
LWLALPLRLALCSAVGKLHAPQELLRHASPALYHAAPLLKGPSMDRLFTHIANRIAAMIGRPLAFILAAATILAWAATGPFFGFSDTWQLVVNTSTTIITFLIVFLIQNSQNRDAAAIQAKLDELIRAVDGARNHFIGIEHLTDREVEAIRSRIETECAEIGDDIAHLAVARMQERL